MMDAANRERVADKEHGKWNCPICEQYTQFVNNSIECKLNGRGKLNTASGFPCIVGSFITAEGIDLIRCSSHRSKYLIQKPDKSCWTWCMARCRAEKQ